MALFTDGPACTSEDLRAYESAILDVASGEGIELSTKLRLAQQEVGFEIVTFLLHNGEEWLDSERGLQKVVVTDALRNWVAVHSLAAVYRDAYYRQLNDRYKEKWAQYSLLTREAKQRYFDTGVAVVPNPISKPPAPSCGTERRGQLAAHTLFVSVAWKRDDQTSEPSDPVSIDVRSGELATVRCIHVPAGVEGWYVYAGATAGALWAQTPEAIYRDSAWSEPEIGIANSGEVARGQSPAQWVTAKGLLQRG